MDGQRFDELTRRIGAGTSRRRVLKLLTGGIAGGLAAASARRSSAAAQTGCLGQDAACTTAGSCCDGLVCLSTTPDVGVCSAACRIEGGNCRLDEECCDDLPCVQVAGEPLPTCGGVVCSGLSESCASGDDCCGTLICDDSICKIGCGVQDVPCDLVVECCEGFFCTEGGVCGTTSCLGAGEACPTTGGEAGFKLAPAAQTTSCCFGACCGGVCCAASEICFEGVCEVTDECPVGEVQIGDGSCCPGPNVCGGGGAGGGTFCCETGICCDYDQCIVGGDCCTTADCPSGETCVAHVCQTTDEECPAGTVDVYGVCCPEASVCGEVAEGEDGAAVCCSDGVCCDDECIDDGACCADADCDDDERCKDHVCVKDKKDDDQSPPPPPPPPVTATTLPSTGSGTTDGDAGGLAPLLGAGLAAGTAALIAGKTRQRTTAPDSDSTS